MALIVCGTICSISALGFAWSARAANGPAASADATARVIAQMKSMGVSNFNFNFPTAETASSVGPMVLTILDFLLGASLIGLGVWASLDPSASAHAWGLRNGHLHKEPIPAADETRL